MAKELNVELNVNATEATKALDKFGGTLEDVYGEGVQPLNFAIGELEDRLYEMAAAGKSGTKEFNEMAQEVGKMKKVIIETDLAVDGMAMTTSQQLSGSMMGLVSGFELAQGAMGAFGVESEKVEEMLLRVQSASAIADGLQGIRESVSSFKALKNSIMATSVVQKAFAVVSAAVNAIMSANPIGAVVAGFVALGAAVAAVIANFRAITDWLGITDSEEEELAGNRARRAEENLKNMELQSAKEQDNFDRKIALAKAEGKATFELEQMKQKAIMETTRARNQELIALRESLRAQGEYTKEKQDEINASIRANNKAFLDAKNQLKINEIEHNKAVEDEQEKHQQEINAKRKASYEKNKARKEKELEEEKRRLEEERKAREEAEKARIEKEDAQYKLLQELRNTDRENEIAALIEQYETKFALAEGNAELEKELAIKQKEDIAEINKRYADEEAARQKELEEKEKEAKQKKKEAAEQELADKRALEDAKVQLTMDALSIIGDVADLFANKGEKAARRAFAIQKAVSIAQATASTAQAIVKTLAETTDPTPTQSLRIGNAIAIGAAGAVQIAKIAATKFQGGGSGAGGGTPNIAMPSGGGSRPAEFNVIGNSGTNQLAETLNKPTKAYVVGSEITTQQSLDRNRVKNASI